MKAKKVLAVFLAMAMMLSTFGFSAMAEEAEVVENVVEEAEEIIETEEVVLMEETPEEQTEETTDYVADVNGVGYATIDEAVANWKNNTTLTLLADVQLSDVIKLSSTEYHILDLGTFTMTAASKKNAIEFVNNGRSSASYALDIKADANNPGGITATSKACIQTTGKSGTKDRPIIRFYNGIYNASNVIKHSGSNGTNCPQFWIYNGEFNGSISTNRALIQIYGGTFNAKSYISPDSSAYTLISGGRFVDVNNNMGSALNSDKWTYGTSKGTFNVNVYVDEEGYYVVTKDDIEFPGNFQASADYMLYAKSMGQAKSTLVCSKVATDGALYYMNAEHALRDNPTDNVTLYTDINYDKTVSSGNLELDLTSGAKYTGTITLGSSGTLTVLCTEDNKFEGTVIPAANKNLLVDKKEEVVLFGNSVKVYTLTFSNATPSDEENAAANIGGDTYDVYYTNLETAVEFAKDGDVIELLGNVTVNEPVEITADVKISGNGYTIKGADVEITAGSASDETAVTPIIVNGAEVVLEDVTLLGGDCINEMETANENSYGIAGNGLVANNATVTIANCTIEGGASGAVYTRSAGSAIVTSNSEIIVEDSTLANGKPARDNVITTQVIDTDEASELSLEDVTLDSAKSSYASAAVISNSNGGNNEVPRDAEITMSGNINVVGNKLANVNIVTPADEEVRFSGSVDSSYVSDILTVRFDAVKQDDEADEVSDLYNIVIEGNNNYINRLSTADFVFDFTGTPATANGAIDYEIIPVAPVNVTPDYNVENRYMFNFDGVTQPDATDIAIVIGQVKINGYGAYSLVLDADFENMATTATIADNIVEYFYVGGAADGNLELNLGSGISGSIAVPTRDLTIKVSFPNNIVARPVGYQDMRVIVEGPEGYSKTVELADGKGSENLYENGCYYKVDILGELTLNSAYTVTLEGAGYRTVKYTVNMTEPKTLNFWNNVKDNEVYVETSESGIEKYAQKVTFLAGDIVKDNNINVYDLSAVVSYFGEIDLDKDNKPEYAKYDLNRDGKIDSKDVAYVLVSWGN